MDNQIYLLVHDYCDLCGPMYDAKEEHLSLSKDNLVLEIKTTGPNQSFWDLLSSESDRHFEHIIKTLFPNSAVDAGITRDIARYDCSYQIVPQDKLPIPESENGTLLYNFWHYPIFASSLIDIEDYVSYSHRDYYDVFYKFDNAIMMFYERLREMKVRRGFERALGEIKGNPKAIEQLAKSLTEE